MKKEIYKRFVEGYEIFHASIHSKGMMSFFAQKTQPVTEKYQQPENLPSRCILYIPDFYNKDDGFDHYSWGKGIKRGYVHIGDRITMAETFGTVWESRTDDQWHKITTEARDKAHLVSGLKTIGNTLFACGNHRKIYQRNDFNNWVDLTDYDKHAYVYADIYEREKKGINHIGYPMGFTCFDGFDEEDIYAGGLYGAFWRYDGKQWHRVDLPSNKDINDIVCAPNGKVYVIMADGQIIIGREDQWKALENKVDQSYSFAAGVSSAAWFKDKLYMSTSFDLYVLDGEDFSKYQFPEGGHKQSSFGGVTACEEALLSYGSHQALIFDGKKWTEIINQPLFSQS